MKNADMPAMPMFSDNAEPCIVRDPETGKKAPATGLTKREMMAMHIATGFAADKGVRTCDIAKLATEVADLLLAELEKSQ